MKTKIDELCEWIKINKGFNTEIINIKKKKNLDSVEKLVVYIDDEYNLIELYSAPYHDFDDNTIISKIHELNLNEKLSYVPASFNSETFHLIEDFKKLEMISLLPPINSLIDLSFMPKSCSITFQGFNSKTEKIDLSLIKFPTEFNSLSLLTPFKNIKQTNKHEINELSIGLIADQKDFDEALTLHENIKSIVIYNNISNEKLYIDLSKLTLIKNAHVLDMMSSSELDNKFSITIDNVHLENLFIMDVILNSNSNLKNCKSLRHINIQNTPIDNLILQDILKSPFLNDINISSSNLSINNDFSNNSVEHLSLNNCSIKNFDFIECFSKVSSIDLTDNYIDRIPVNLPGSLLTLDLTGCNVVNIPKEVIEKVHLCDEYDEDLESPQIIIKNNPIENPPLEIIRQGNDALKEYCNSMEGETTTLNEAKIIFVGDGAVGKTSLMKRLVSDSFCEQEEQTDGIEIELLSINTEDGEVINASIWDFGGQQILQATHQLFLSKRSIYILVVEDRKNDQHKDQDIEQWLTQINSLGGEPSILVVKNKIDENPHSDIQSYKLKEKFPNIVGFFEISCKETTGIQKLKKSLSEIIINLPMRKIELPKNWLNVKNELKIQAEKNDLLYLNTYQDICAQYDIKSKLAKETLLKMLHDLGAVIAFDELASHNTAILNPHWITEGIYALLKSDTLVENNGIIDRISAQEALDKYAEHDRFDGKAQYIIDAMKTFDLCHLTTEADQYLIPILLPPQIDFNKSVFINNRVSTLRFIFKFENLLPPSLLPMFLVKIHENIQGNRRWRTGAIVSPASMKATAIVDADLVKREIHISIIGEDKRDLFVTLRTTIKEILNRITDPKKIGLQELIPLGDTNERVSYDELIGLKNMGHSMFPCGKIGRLFPVSELLGEIEPPEDTEKALKILLKSNNNSLISVNMNQTNNQNQQSSNTATGGNATNNVSSAQTQDQVASATATATVTIEIKQELKAFKGQSEFIIEDIEEAIDDLTSSDRVLKDNAKRECEKVSKAIEVLEKDVEDQETADQNLRHFSRVQNFFEGALQKANSVGKVIDTAGNLYNQVESLADKYNSIATKFAMPLVALAGLG